VTIIRIDPARLQRAVMRARLDLRQLSALTQIEYDRLRYICGELTRPTELEVEAIAAAVGARPEEITIAAVVVRKR
jgi:hypothetical protein